MEQLGKVADWNQGRGYGFIQPLQAGAPRLFFRASGYRQDGRQPEPGEPVRYSVRRHAGGRGRATSPRARTAAPARPRRQPGGGDGWAVWLALAAHLAGLGWALHSGRIPPLVPLALAGLSCAAWVACAWDKHAARHGRRRIAEARLHLLELLGGWPGAALAQRMLRHKTRKPSYRIGFWLAVLVNAAVFWGWVLGLS